MNKETKIIKKNKGGRPTKYNKDIVAKICKEIIRGKSIISITKSKDMPTISTIYLWLGAHEAFSELYTKAKEDQADTLVEEILDIADNSTNDWMKINDPDNMGYRVNGEAINRARLRVDTRKWIASKLKAKKYGDKGITVTNNTQINNTTTIELDSQLNEKLLGLLDINKNLEKND